MSVPVVENPYAGQGAVLLDIGGDVGALVVTMPAGMEGVEVEVRPSGVPDTGLRHHPHVAVVGRPVDGVLVPSLVFADLVAGRYDLFFKHGEHACLGALVVGGEVTAADWPT